MSYDTQVIKALTDKFSEPERSALVNALVLPHIKKELETKELLERFWSLPEVRACVGRLTSVRRELLQWASEW